jgi:hypothetical protein
MCFVPTAQVSVCVCVFVVVCVCVVCYIRVRISGVRKYGSIIIVALIPHTTHIT